MDHVAAKSGIDGDNLVEQFVGRTRLRWLKASEQIVKRRQTARPLESGPMPGDGQIFPVIVPRTIGSGFDRKPREIGRQSPEDFRVDPHAKSQLERRRQRIGVEGIVFFFFEASSGPPPHRA